MNKIKKILLVVPPGTVFSQKDGTTQVKECMLPIGIAYLSAQIKKTEKYNVRIYDMVAEGFENDTRISDNTILYGDTFEDYKCVLQEYKPDLVGIQCMLSSRSRSALELCKITKNINMFSHPD